MKRRGFTLLELLIGVATGSAVTWAVMGLWSGATKLTRVAQSTALLSNALLLEDAISRDVCQLGLDPAQSSPLLLSEAAVSFYRVRFRGDDTVLFPLKYARVPGPGGTHLLQRTEWKAGANSVKTFSHAPLKQLAFSQVEDPMFKTHYLRVYMQLVDDDRTRAQEYSLVLRIPAPAQLGNPHFSAALRFEVMSALFPVEP